MGEAVARSRYVVPDVRALDTVLAALVVWGFALVPLVAVPWLVRIAYVRTARWDVAAAALVASALLLVVAQSLSAQAHGTWRTAAWPVVLVRAATWTALAVAAVGLLALRMTWVPGRCWHECGPF